MQKIRSQGFMMKKTVEILEVIVTNLATRGDGIKTPIRIITQYWTLDGELLFELDPMVMETKELLREARVDEQTYTK